MYRSRWTRGWMLALSLATATAAIGCLFHKGVIQVTPSAHAGGESREPLSEEAIRVVVGVVERVAMDEGFRAKRAASAPFGSKLLAYYASDEQISMAVSVSRNSRSISIQIRDVNHLKETSYIKELRSSIESGIQTALPDVELSYESRH